MILIYFGIDVLSFFNYLSVKSNNTKNKQSILNYAFILAINFTIFIVFSTTITVFSYYEWISQIIIFIISITIPILLYHKINVIQSNHKVDK